MIKNIYAIKDHKRWFTDTFVDDNDPSAVRNFSYGVCHMEGVMNFAPQDFDLFKVGTFNTESGMISGLVPIEFMCNGLDISSAEVKGNE